MARPFRETCPKKKQPVVHKYYMNDKFEGTRVYSLWVYQCPRGKPYTQSRSASGNVHKIPLKREKGKLVIEQRAYSGTSHTPKQMIEKTKGLFGARKWQR